MISRSRRKLRITRSSTRGWSRRDAALRGAALCCTAILSLGGFAVAAEPASSHGTTMLEALRHRDAGERWDAAGAALAPLASELPPVVEPQIGNGTPATNASWRPSRDSEPGRVTLPAPSVFASQTAPRLPYEPLEPIPERTEDDSLTIDPTVQPVAKTPSELRKINEILPYFDYEPDPNLDDPCLYLCPRPDGLPCKQYGPDEFVPACPEEVSLGDEPFTPRILPPSVFAWTASNIHYNPLYFQDVQLERYGHSYGNCVQPFVSVGRFGVQLLALPYQMTLDLPCKEMYPLGYYRPGEPAPKLCYQVPFNAKAAVVTGAFYSGLAVILP